MTVLSVAYSLDGMKISEMIGGGGWSSGKCVMVVTDSSSVWELVKAHLEGILGREVEVTRIKILFTTPEKDEEGLALTEAFLRGLRE